MSKSITVFSCSKCGAQYPKWTGRCLECGSWGTISEETSVAPTKLRKNQSSGSVADIVNLQNIPVNQELRWKTKYAEFNRVVGDGLAPGSCLLLGGDPGIGKSTLALQIAASIEDSLYFAGEESTEQIASRWQRLKIKPVSLSNESNVANIIATINKHRPKLAIIDSIQTTYCSEVDGEPGNINQLKACTAQLMTAAKETKTAIIIIGHVTKDGQMAGPKTIEHLVDAVLYFEGDKHQQYRILRAMKNRFGQTGEIGVWEMSNGGLVEVLNPAAIFIGSDQLSSGSVITAAVEGSRIFLVEIQALVNKTSFGYPRRLGSGFSNQRLEVILAVLAKKMKLSLANYDLYVNVTGGFVLKEPAADLAVATAIVSAYYDRVLPDRAVVFGEIGLDGQVRVVLKTKERLQTAIKLGYQNIIMPTLKIKLKEQKIKFRELNSINDLAQLFK